MSNNFKRLKNQLSPRVRPNFSCYEIPCAVIQGQGRSNGRHSLKSTGRGGANLAGSSKSSMTSAQFRLLARVAPSAPNPPKCLLGRNAPPDEVSTAAVVHSPRTRWFVRRRQIVGTVICRRAGAFRIHCNIVSHLLFSSRVFARDLAAACADCMGPFA